jgi:hypothetical protein
MKELFFNGGEVYLIIRRIPIHNFTKRDGSVIPEIFNGWKQYLGADKVLKTQTHFLFCETVEEPVWEEAK